MRGSDAAGVSDMPRINGMRLGERFPAVILSDGLPGTVFFSKIN